MKIMITILGILIVLAGILPFIGEQGLKIVPTIIPTGGSGYYAMIIVIGVIGIIYGVANNMVLGIEKFVTIIVGLLTVLGGILPFIGSYIPEGVLPIAIPTGGTLYSGVIILIGLIGIIYGLISAG